MFKRTLGKSGMEVTALGLGCMEIGGKMKDGEGLHVSEGDKNREKMFSLGSVDDKQSDRIIGYALDHGINLIDTAPAYGAGHSERIIGRAIGKRRDGVIVATKFGKRVDEENNRFGRYSTERELVENIRRECDQSLERLGTDHIDLYQYHQMDYGLLAYAEEVLEILESLVSAGKIRYYGWSTENPECARVFSEGEHFVAVQHNLNVISDAQDLLSICEKSGQASIARGVLGMGFLSGKYTRQNYKTLLDPEDFRLRDDSYFVTLLEKVELVKQVLVEGGRTPSQGALAWVWARSENTIPIVGFRTLAQMEENIGSLDLGPLSGEQMERIEALLGRRGGDAATR